MRRSWSGLTFMVVHSKLREGREQKSEKKSGFAAGSLLGSSTCTIRADVPRTVCTMAHPVAMPALGVGTFATAVDMTERASTDRQFDDASRLRSWVAGRRSVSDQSPPVRRRM